ncbi:unnamed protein product [Closterium sp. NIES-54]
MAAVAGWGDTTNMPTDDGVWGADAPDETAWGETPAARTTRLLAEAEQRVAEMEIFDSGRIVGVELVPAASDQESDELVLAPGEYVDVEVRVPPPNLTRYVAPAFDQIRSDGHQLLLSFFANAEYYLRAQGAAAAGAALVGAAAAGAAAPGAAAAGAAASGAAAAAEIRRERRGRAWPPGCLDGRRAREPRRPPKVPRRAPGWDRAQAPKAP